MRLRSLRFTALLALTAAPLLLPAEEEISSKEEERLASLAREDSEWYAPKNSVSVGFRVLGSGGKVHFGKLGTVDYNTSIVPIGTGISSANRVYNNGYVNFDTPRANEMNSDAKQTSPQGGRYQLTSGIDPATGAPNVVADYLSYTVDRTRVWSYSVPSQATQDPGHIALSSYSATSDGGRRIFNNGRTMLEMKAWKRAWRWARTTVRSGRCNSC